MHIRNTNQTPKFSVDPQTCASPPASGRSRRSRAALASSAMAAGTFASRVRAWAGSARDPDGELDQDEADPLLEADVVKARGTLTL